MLSRLAFFPWILANWQIVVGLAGAFVLSLALSYCQGREDGRASVYADLASKEAESLRKAAQATTEADKRGAVKEAEQARDAREALKAIEKAEADDANPLDALMRGDRD